MYLMLYTAENNKGIKVRSTLMSPRLIITTVLVLISLIGGHIASASEQTAASQTPASPYSGSMWERAAVTGDWGGVRNDLAAKGIAVESTLTQTWQKVVDGGTNKSGEYGGRYNATIHMDFKKMGLWERAFLTVEIEGRYTEASANHNTGSLMPVNMSDFFPELGEKGEQLTVPSVVYTQFLSESFGVYGGKCDLIMNGDKNEFAHGKGDTQFMNMAFNLNPALGIVAPPYAWGGGAIILPTQNPNEWVASVGAVKTLGEASTSGIDDIDNGPTTLAAETRLTTDFFDMTGHQLVGYAHSDKSYTSLDQNPYDIIVPGFPAKKESGTWAAYYNFDQYLYEPDKGSGRGAGVFGRFGSTDGEANPVHYFASIGIGGKGICDDRPLDRFGIGYYYLWIANQEVTNAGGFGDTKGVEAFYNIALTKWVYLTPDIQVIDPSKTQVDTAVVVGARLQMVF
jgi:porin